MRVLVTGGAGFIGSHTVDRLLAEEMEVVVLDNLDPQVHGNDSSGRGGRQDLPANLRQHENDPRCRFILGDVRDKEDLAEALQGVEAVIHLAAAVGVGQSMYQPYYYSDVNLNGTANLLQSLAEQRGQSPNSQVLKKLVVASSMSIYGEGSYRCSRCGEKHPGMRNAHQVSQGQWNPPCPDCGDELAPIPTRESKPLQSTSIYAITKKTQEEMVLCFGRAYEIPAVALRYFNVYGSRQSLDNPYTGVLAIFLSRFLNDKPPLLFEDGRQSRDFVHVRDIAEANLRALTQDGADFQAVHVGTGMATSILDLARVLSEKIGNGIEPKALNRYRAGDIRHCYADTSEIEKRLGWRPQTQLKEGLEELLDWAATQSPADQVEAAVKELAEKGLVR